MSIRLLLRPLPARPLPHLPGSARAFAAAVALASLLAATDARADVTSWMAVGGGYTGQIEHANKAYGDAGTFSYSIGVGSSPLGWLVLGGLFRGTTMFGLGTDIGLALRGATGGFARGNWGVALDLGPMLRTWGGDAYGTWPVQAVATIGAPWGFQLALGAQVSSVAAGGTPSEGFTATLELDLLRLTVMRQGATERWWPNPSPAGGHPGEPASTDHVSEADDGATRE